MKEDIKKIKIDIKFSLIIVLSLWIVKLVEFIGNISFASFGVYPLHVDGLYGIIFAPLIHSNFPHLISNSLPLLILLPSILYFYQNIAKQVLLFNYIVPNILVWIFGRSSYHIGASGFIYGLVFFIFFSGVFRRDVKSISLSLIVTFLYGGLVWGVFPTDPSVSFESHLFGALTGIVLSYIYRTKKKIKKYDWEDEDVEYGGNKEISYKEGYPFE